MEPASREASCFAEKTVCYADGKLNINFEKYPSIFRFFFCSTFSKKADVKKAVE